MSFPCVLLCEHMADPWELACSRSFARIHRTNLTKQGVLPLTFINEADYSLISAGDVISTTGFNELLRGDLTSEIKVIVTKPNGETLEIKTDHALSKDQVMSDLTRVLDRFKTDPYSAGNRLSGLRADRLSM